MRRPLLGLAALCASLLLTSVPSPAQVSPPTAANAAAARTLAQLDRRALDQATRPARARKPRARTPPAPAQPYSLAVTAQHAAANVEVIMLTVGPVAYFSINDWRKSTSRPFHFRNEGWFGSDTYAGGMDKLGHFFSASAMADLFTWTLNLKGFDPYQSAASGSIISWLVMAGIEVGDGFFHYGFSYEDMTFNTLGAAFSYLRNTVPGLKEKLDYRIQFLPTSNSGFSANDLYSDKKFLFALKLGGFEHLKATPWRFVELHAGYFARGFSEHERALGRPLERSLYAGVGLNLGEILFSQPSVRDTPLGQIGRFAFEHFQVPYTSLNTRE